MQSPLAAAASPMAAAAAAVRDAYEHVRGLGPEAMEGGRVADYIPELANADPAQFGAAFCAVDGTLHVHGDATTAFCVQSCCKPLNYAMARQRQANGLGPTVHDHVGYEPSGRAFNAFALSDDHLPHNPLINAGAIMVASLLLPKEEPSRRFGAVRDFYARLMGGGGAGAMNPEAKPSAAEREREPPAQPVSEPAVHFNNSVYLSEKHHADRNRSLAYYMRENGAYHESASLSPSELEEHLDLYYQCCAISMDCAGMARIAATFANAGVVPGGGDDAAAVVDRSIVKDTLAIMLTCGMYDYSGQFAFRYGLAAKSGVSGCIFIVIPRVGGVCVWSPALDAHGNSVRGIRFCADFTARTQSRFHIVAGTLEATGGADSFADDAAADDGARAEALTFKIIACAARGDLAELRRVHERLLLHDQADAGEASNGGSNSRSSDAARAAFERTDYDGRSALHLACEHGHADLIEFLLVEVAVRSSHKRDRWGTTPLDALQRFIDQRAAEVGTATVDATDGAAASDDLERRLAAARGVQQLLCTSAKCERPLPV